MNPLVLAAVAAALAMDACAVAITIALTLRPPSRPQTLRLAFHFGLFQFFMPVAGWTAGREMVKYIQGYDHWIAFGLLTFIGGKMIYESRLIGEGEKVFASDPTRGAMLVMLSIATSIDALAVGVTLSMLGVKILYPAAVIGAVAFALTVVGMELGCALGRVFGRRIEDAGGIVLILIGAFILFGHLLG